MQGCGSGWILSGSNLRAKNLDPEPIFENKKLDPDPTFQKTQDQDPALENQSGSEFYQILT